MGGSASGPDTLTSTGSSSGSSQSSQSGSGSSSTTYPGYVLPYAQQFIQAMAGLVMPGGQIAASPYAYGQVAPWSVPQLQAAQAIGAFGATSPLIQGAQQQQAKTLAGQYLTPQSNPYLKQYYDAAADALTQQYKFATDPSLLAHGAQTGTLVSSPMVQQNQLARYNLGQNLANLAAGIYEPAYQYERGQQTAAAQEAPALTQAQYIPAHELMQLGQQEQGQAQNVFNQATRNLTQLGLWPYQALGMYGNALGPAAGPGSQTSFDFNQTGNTISNMLGTQTVPNTMQGGGGFK